MDSSIPPRVRRLIAIMIKAIEQKKINILKRNRTLLISAIVIYCAAGFALLPFFRYQINPDGISYISIAQKYLIGDIDNAINGHFSPLFSWLLVPFLFLSV